MYDCRQDLPFFSKEWSNFFSKKEDQRLSLPLKKSIEATIGPEHTNTYINRIQKKLSFYHDLLCFKHPIISKKEKILEAIKILDELTLEIKLNGEKQILEKFFKNKVE